ncbi:beta-lactamase/transpeptidase-like protein [Favolaschia claudopus]|uniref:Beta-lactamase/transpeptidase-like protein n=1 Tax=Favolaschia claudopus TaxID=2862362 RepID=A0AAW0A9N3_9AGAR
MHQRTTLLNPSGDETHPSSARGSSGHPMPPSITNTQKETLDRIIDEAVSSRSTPASYFGVASAEGVLYQRTAGRKQVDDPGSAPINEDTVFGVCSQTKLITTIAALQLIERGQIALDTVVETILPELANPVVVTGYDEAGWVKTTRPAKEKITLGNLLNHTSGLDYWAERRIPSSDRSRG